ncbi:MAG: histidinol phosphate phosphatase domain-containing protein [Deltaproteobacteria bacterium]|nr:MAG: histidinol phosphate phosphatase domain-containing protein [Deltaproteobacteria bacterium]
MIDLHTHSLFSDGELLVSELVRRAEEMGYRFIGITDHADRSNLDLIIPRVVRAVEEINRHNRIQAVAGIELTHVPPATIGPLAVEARELGARLVVVHGETIVEPVMPGTNRAGLEADIDILAHPGLLTEEEAALAARRGIHLEISGRKGHSFANGHVVRMAQAAGASLVVNSDAHAPGDLLSGEMVERIVLGAGLDQTALQQMTQDAETLLRRRTDERN